MWNHRVVKNTYKNGEVGYSIREVYYNDDGGIWGMSKEPRAPYGEDLEGLKWALEHMLEALNDEVLDEDELEFAKPSWDTDFPDWPEDDPRWEDYIKDQ